MGILGGLQVLRAHSDWENFEDPNLCKNILHCLVPWGCGKSIYGLESKEKVALIKQDNLDKDKAMKIWKKRVDFSASLYVGILASLCIIKVALDNIYGDGEGN